MHVGRAYPYLYEYWQGECFFWPGYVPMKLHVSCASGYGTAWDLLTPGVVTEIGVADAFSVGDPQWNYVWPGGDPYMQVLFHKVALSPNCKYSVVVRIVQGLIASVAASEVESPRYTFDGWFPFRTVSNFPPNSLGIVPPIQIRPATWSEV